MAGQSVRGVKDVSICGSAVMVDPSVLTDLMNLMRLVKVRECSHFDSLYLLKQPFNRWQMTYDS